jgi:hypothetical protein
LQHIELARISQEVTATHRQGPFRYAGSGNHCLSAVTSLRVSNSLHTCLSFVVLVSGSSCLLTFDLGAGPFKKFFNQSYAGDRCDKPRGSDQPPPLGRSGRITLRPISSLAMRLRKQSTPRDFNSGAWSRKLRTAPEGPGALSNYDDIDRALSVYNSIRQPLSERIVSHGRKLGMQLGVGINTDEDRKFAKLLQSPEGILDWIAVPNFLAARPGSCLEPNNASTARQS